MNAAWPYLAAGDVNKFDWILGKSATVLASLASCFINGHLFSPG